MATFACNLMRNTQQLSATLGNYLQHNDTLHPVFLLGQRELSLRKDLLKWVNLLWDPDDSLKRVAYVAEFFSVTAGNFCRGCPQHNEGAIEAPLLKHSVSYSVVMFQVFMAPMMPRNGTTPQSFSPDTLGQGFMTHQDRVSMQGSCMSLVVISTDNQINFGIQLPIECPVFKN